MCDMLKIVVSRVWPCQYIHWYQWCFDLFLISVIHVYEIDKLVDLFIGVVPRHQRSIVLNFICWKSELVSHNHSGIQPLYFLILDNHVVFKVIISLQLFYNQIYCIHDCVLQASSEIENIPERVTNETRTTVSGMEKVVFLLFRNRLHADGCKFYFSKSLTLL